MRKICINISDKSFTRIPFAKSKHAKKASRPQEWFDNDCKIAKQEINKKRKSYQEALRGNFFDSETKSQKNCYFQALKNFNAVKRRKEQLYWKQKKELLGISKVKNPKEFWNKLNLKHKGIPFNFSQNELYEYFKALSCDKIKDASDSGDSNIEHDIDVESETTNLFKKEILDILDRVISIDEVRQVIRNMKNGKAAGPWIKSFQNCSNMLTIIFLIS